MGSRMRALPGSAGAASMLLIFGLALAGGATAAPGDVPSDCGNPFDNGEVGPWDFNNGEDRTNPQKIPIIEKFHFNRDVESLDKGQSSAYALDDLDYVLRAVPNHPRALNAVARYEIEKGGIPAGRRSAACWFERALEFRPEDGTVWLIYGNFSARTHQPDVALEAYERAKKLMPESIEVDYNMGLLYYKLGQYDRALVHARTAYAGNYPLQGLKRKLAEKGLDVGP